MALSQSIVKKSLESHSWLGLMVSALMYIICLSGTLLVFHAELEQWEQADAPKIESFDLTGAESTFNQFLSAGKGVTDHMYLVLPTDESPHARIATEVESWFLNQDGSIGPVESNAWSSLLLDLHLYLHLPQTWGMILVSALGAVLVGLIISGFLAHPGIFKDAFRLRRGSSWQLAQTDLHNRLSVWGAPFHLTIAITGAYFGLALPLLAIIAEAEFDGDREQIVAMVFGEEPALEPKSGPVEIGKAIESIRAIDPDARPFTVIVHDAEAESPLLEIYARHPGRLTWGEGYQFSIDGQFINKAGWTDGSIGQQVLYSIYRLHFGTFDGMLSKFLYLLLGFALTIVAASGVNIWLAKRRKEDGIADLWEGVVWGTPIAMAASAILSLFTSAFLGLAFWGILALSCASTLAIRDASLSRFYMRLLLVLLLSMLLFLHVLIFGRAGLAGGALLVNVFLMATIMFLVRYTFREKGLFGILEREVVV